MGSVFSESLQTKEYFQSMNFVTLIEYIQPKWNKYNMGRGVNSMSEIEMKNLLASLEVYKEKGGDASYFTAGAGAPDNCIIS